MAVITVLGAGRMGTAFCTPLLDRGHQVRLVGTHLDREYIDALRASGVHPGLGHPLPPGASFHQADELAAALEGADMLALGVSSKGITWAARTLASVLSAPLPLLLVTKGLEWDGSKFRPMPDVLVDGLRDRVGNGLRPVAITGPCIAGELIRRRDTCVMFAGRDPAAVRLWADAARTPYYRVWSSADFEGCEASAALKNAFAIAVGFGAGAWETDYKRAGAGPEPLGVAAHNVEAAVFAEAVAEMSGLVGLAGGDPATPFGLVGVGDLLVTTHARNALLGRLLGSGLTYDRALEEMAGLTLEGVETIKTVGRALEDLERSGRASPADFPLMRHLVSVIGGTAIRIPFDLFGFGDPRS